MAEVSKLCLAGEKIVTICEKGDKLLEEEIAKVYGKTKLKGWSPRTSFQLAKPSADPRYLQVSPTPPPCRRAPSSPLTPL